MPKKMGLVFFFHRVKNGARGVFCRKTRYLCGCKKNEKSLQKRVIFAQNTFFLYFPSKTKYESPFSHFLNFGFARFKRSGYEESLKCGENRSKHKFWYLTSKTIYIWNISCSGLFGWLFQILWACLGDALCEMIFLQKPYNYSLN